MYSQYVAVSAGTKEYNENLLSGKLASAPRVEPDPGLPDTNLERRPLHRHIHWILPILRGKNNLSYNLISHIPFITIAVQPTYCSLLRNFISGCS